MAKFLRNTTGAAITIASVGKTIGPGVTHTIQEDEYTLWAQTAVHTEIDPLITSGDLVVNDGIGDLIAARGIDFLEHPDTAFNVRFLSEPERTNQFVSKNVQEAIEEARTGATVLSPVTTVGATTAIAFSQTLDDDSAYHFEGIVSAKRTDADGDEAYIQQQVYVKRESGGSATISGDIFQVRSRKTDSELDACWEVTGNVVQLKVFGATGKTVKWQPQVIERERVSN